MKISDIDILSDDKFGNNRFVVFFNASTDLEVEKIIPAKAMIAGVSEGVPCEIYKPVPNNADEVPHVHLRAKSRLGLKGKLKIGDVVIVGC